MQNLEPSIRTLRLLEIMAEGCGMVRAAERLGMSQSAASHALAALERAMGARLFARGAGQLRISNTGERILPHVRQMLRSLDAIGEELASEANVQQGALRIAAVPSIASSAIPPLLREFTKKYPGIDVTLLEGTDHEVAEWVRRKVTHCGFAALPVAGVEAEPIGKDEWTILSPADKFSDQTQIKLQKLTGCRFLLSGGGCEDHIHRLFDEAGVAMPAHLLVRQMDTIQAMVAEGLGVSIVPSLTLARKPRNVRVLKLVPRRFRMIGLLLPLETIHSSALQRWTDLVKDKFSEILKRA
jgi:DNA-binding transcriptional LysR family regulator